MPRQSSCLKKYSKKEDSLGELQDNIKYKIQIIRIPEREKKEQGIEILIEKINTENFLNTRRGKTTQVQKG